MAGRRLKRSCPELRMGVLVQWYQVASRAPVARAAAKATPSLRTGGIFGVYSAGEGTDGLRSRAGISRGSRFLP